MKSLILSLALGSMFAAAPVAALAQPESQVLSLCRRAMAATEVQQQMTIRMARTLDATSDKFTELFPQTDAGTVAAYHKAYAEALQAAQPKLLDDLAQTCAANFSPRELKEIIAFYDSPTGRALSAKRETVLVPAMERSFDALQPAIMADFQQRFCTQTGSCDPAQSGAPLAPSQKQ